MESLRMAERRVDPKVMQIVRKAWAAVLERRQQDSQTGFHRFTDSETDVGFLKDIDALNTLLEPFLLAPTSFVDPPLKTEELEEHIAAIVKEFASQQKADSEPYLGFSAAPYPYLQWATDYVDSAASFLRLACNACAVLKAPGIERKDSNLERMLKEPCSSAIDFLLAARIEDKNGVRWQAIARPTEPPGRFANLFFTNLAALALSKALETPQVSRWMGQERREQIESALRGVTKWVLGQYNPATKTFHMDAAKTSAPAVGVACALEILYTLGDPTAEPQKTYCAEALRQIVVNLKDLNQASALQLDVYHSIPAPTGTTTIFYDDRRYIGAFLSVFAFAKSKDPDVVDDDFLHAGEVLFQGVSEEWIDEPSGMWDDGRPLICFTQDALVGLIRYSLHGQVEVISMREDEMRAAIQEALRSDDVLTAIVNCIRAKSQASRSLFADKTKVIGKEGNR
jgi:hypothetical protein